MKRLALFICLLLASLSSLFSSGFFLGGEVGYALNFMETITAWPETEYKPGHGADAAIRIGYSFDNGLSINSGIRYIGKSFGYTHTNNGKLYSNYMEMNHFLQIPISLRYTYDLGFINLFAGGGGYIGVWFLSQSFGDNISAAESYGKGAIYEENKGEVSSFNSGDNLFEVGLLAEAGISLDITDDIQLDFALRYEGDVTSLVRDYQKNTVHRYNNSLVITAGCIFGIGGK